MYDLQERQFLLQDCPNCGKRALARIGNERFDCINCNFYRDLSRRGVGRFDGFSFFLVLIAVIVVLVMIGG